jgi:hypothetical protein
MKTLASQFFLSFITSLVSDKTLFIMLTTSFVTFLQRPYLVLPHKLARDKEFAAYDYIGPSDIELYPNGYFKMAAENSSD